MVDQAVREFLSKIGVKGGKSKSKAKIEAVRQNMAKARLAAMKKRKLGK